MWVQLGGPLIIPMIQHNLCHFEQHRYLAGNYTVLSGAKCGNDPHKKAIISYVWLKIAFKLLHLIRIQGIMGSKTRLYFCDSFFLICLLNFAQECSRKYTNSCYETNFPQIYCN